MRSTTTDTPFNAIVMAADRNPNDPVAKAASVACKALAPVAGTAMVLRVLNALEESLASRTAAFVRSAQAAARTGQGTQRRGRCRSLRLDGQQGESERQRQRPQWHRFRNHNRCC